MIRDKLDICMSYGNERRNKIAIGRRLLDLISNNIDSKKEMKPTIKRASVLVPPNVCHLVVGKRRDVASEILNCLSVDYRNHH